MTELELKELVEKIDAKNAEYILNNYDIRNTFRQINDWGTNNVNWLLSEYPEDKREEHRQSVINSLYEDLKKKIARYDSSHLTPANAKVGDGATVVLYTDRNAGTIVKVTKTTITIRRDKAILSPDFKPEWVPGGFAAHCTNQDEQTYTYEPDENGELTTIYWSKKYNAYGQPGNIRAIKGRYEFYDYNF